MKSKASALDAELLLLMTKQDREALADRARLEQSSSNAIARAAIRYYLSYIHPSENPTAA